MVVRVRRREPRDWMSEASRLLDAARKLEGDRRRVYEYFVRNFSVGDLKAEYELSKLGVKEPLEVIEELIEEGILERGIDCFNLAYPLRKYFASRR